MRCEVRRIETAATASVTDAESLAASRVLAWRLGERSYWLWMTENAVAKEVVDVAYRMHTVLGPGLFESVYEARFASRQATADTLSKDSL